MIIKNVGSICSGIETASVAWVPLGLQFEWFSEIAPFPSKLLTEKYKTIHNLGDMVHIPSKLEQGEITAPDLICGGTPCQAFSFAGYKKGLEDDRGNLTLTFLDILDTNDSVRHKKGQAPTLMLWENVVGVLSDKTNAFGCFLTQLTGVTDLDMPPKWPQAGVIHGKTRNVAWRVLDAKYFGIPQQRKRVYVLAGGTDFYPENILFDQYIHELVTYPKTSLVFQKEGHNFEVFREYTDCLYAAYGTKWNGNAAAYNGSLFVLQDGKLRRLSVLETERLMGFPDNYTEVANIPTTARYKAVGNAWAVPVIRWIGERLLAYDGDIYQLKQNSPMAFHKATYCNLAQGIVPVTPNLTLNCTMTPSECIFTTMQSIISPTYANQLYVSKKAAEGIIRRAGAKQVNINPRLKACLESIIRDQED